MKHAKKQLIAALKSLNSERASLYPRKEWLETNRGILLTQIKNTIDATLESKTSVFDNIWEAFSLVMPSRTVYSVVRPFVALLAIMGMAGGGWVGSVSASQNSLPGDVLYNVKLVSEGAHLAIAQVTADDATVATLRVERAARRLDEARQLVRNSGEDKDVAVRVEKAVKDAKTQIQAVKENLAKAKENSPSAVAAMLKVVDREFGGIHNELDGVKTDFATSAASQNSESKVAVEKLRLEIETLVLDTETSAAESMLQNHIRGDKSFSNEDVKKSVGENLDKTIQRINNDELGIIKAPDLITDSTATTTSKDVKKAVEEAKVLLQEEKFDLVLEKVAEAKVLANIVSADAASASKVINSLNLILDDGAKTDVSSSSAVGWQPATGTNASASTSQKVEQIN